MIDYILDYHNHKQHHVSDIQNYDIMINQHHRSAITNYNLRLSIVRGFAVFTSVVG